MPIEIDIAKESSVQAVLDNFPIQGGIKSVQRGLTVVTTGVEVTISPVDVNKSYLNVTNDYGGSTNRGFKGYILNSTTIRFDIFIGAYGEVAWEVIEFN